MDTSPFPRKTVAAIQYVVAGLLAGAGIASLVIGGGTAITKHSRATQTLNPQAITSGLSTSTVMAVPGCAVGDHVEVAVTVGDLGGSTSSIALRGIVTATDTVRADFLNTANTSTVASFDAGTSTVSAQCWAY